MSSIVADLPELFEMLVIAELAGTEWRRVMTVERPPSDPSYVVLH